MTEPRYPEYPYLNNLKLRKGVLNANKLVGLCRSCYLKSQVDQHKKELELNYYYECNWACDVEGCYERYEYEFRLKPWDLENDTPM